MSLRIIFMGTPQFAVASLDSLMTADFNIVAVITAPDKPAGRGLKLTQSAVKKYALDKGLDILQPAKLKDPEFLQTLQNYKADVQVVVAFRMLPEAVWDMPPLGTINLHASLLPQYRGAAPINWAIINGEKETGVTTFKLQHEIDTGNILLQQSVPIFDDETAGSLHDKLMKVGADLLVQTMKRVEEGTPEETDQDKMKGNTVLKHAPKIYPENCEIDWTKSVGSIYNLIRGLSPYPAAYTFLNDKKLKIFAAQPQVEDHELKPGEISTDQKTYVKFAAPDGFLSLEEIQLEGKRKMEIADFLRGYRP